jgi:nicotinic acid mononucleotide adenylyltransferase
MTKKSLFTLIAIVKSEQELGLSSTMIKKALRHGECIDEMVNSSVKSIIIRERLYQE